jgi:hypothetical protein
MASRKERLSSDALTEFEALTVAEKRIKDELNTEIWDLIVCVRQHPQITGPVNRDEVSLAMVADAIVFAHFAGHARTIARLSDLSAEITNQMIAMEANDATPAATKTATAHHA